MYIRQKNTADYEIVVKENAELALQLHPDLFEQVEGEPSEGCQHLNFASE